MSKEFVCSECYAEVNAMWADVCNTCRAKERRHKEMIKAMPTNTKLQSENQRLREALEFYANLENWDTNYTTPTIWDDGDVDLGRRARQALGQGGEGE